MSKIIYLAGYGRSGSTVLDAILGNHPRIVSLGEATFLLDDWQTPGRVCACGEPYASCPFWRDLFAPPPPPQSAAALRRVEKNNGLPKLLSGRVGVADRELYRDWQRRLSDHALERGGADILVDSSKSARHALGRFLALRRLAGADIYVVHLVRDGRATVASLTQTGSNWALEQHRPEGRLPLSAQASRGFARAAAAAAGWMIANAGTMALARLLDRNRYLRLRYEDFVADPASALTAIGRLAGFDPQPLVARLQDPDGFEIGHLSGGNRVRFERRIRLRPPQADGGRDGPPAPLPWSSRLALTLCGGWLQSYYGYRSAPGTARAARR